MGTILHLNISPGGIPKRAVTEAFLAPTGLEGDAHAHPNFHGGPLQAILLITSEGLDELRAQGYAVYPGALGENFTTSGLDHRQIRIGDRYQAGRAVIEITKVRTPCATLDIFNSPGSDRIQDVLRDGLSGFYARVVQPGLVRAGDRISLLDALV